MTAAVGAVAALTLAGPATGVGAQDASPTSAICDGLAATIVGTAGDDRLVGTDGPDVIAGLQGNDVIFGLAGDDVICGGFGNDIIFGGQGFDVLFGAQGNDELFAADGLDQLSEDTRGSRMFGGAGNDNIFGSTRWDRMQGGEGRDLMLGFEGQDWIRSGGSGDFVDGGPGRDDIRTGWGPDRLDLDRFDVVRAGTGGDHCNLDGRPTQLWSCETQQPIEGTPFRQRVEPEFGERINPPAIDHVVSVRNSIDVEVEGVRVITRSVSEELSNATVVEFNGLIIDNGDGPEACIGSINDFDPPQCGGPIIDGLEFHPSWTTYYGFTRLGNHTVRFTWPPVDGHVQLVEERFGEIPVGDDINDPDEPAYPLPPQCAGFDAYVNFTALQAWGEANPDLFGGLLATDQGRVPTLRVVGDDATLEAVRAELRTADLEPCVDHSDFTQATLQQVRDQVEAVLDEIMWTGLSHGIDRVSLDVALADLETAQFLADIVSVPGVLEIEGQLIIIE